MTGHWTFKSDVFGNCNCAANCGCQFNLPSTHGFCQFVEGGVIKEGVFGGVDISGLHWAFIMAWPGEIAEGDGARQIIVDERASDVQRNAIEKIVAGEAGEPGSNHFSVFGSTCSKFHETLYLPIECEIDIAARNAVLNVPGLIAATGQPIIDEFSGGEFHIALARPKGSFEFTYAEIGTGVSTVQGALAMTLEKGSFGQFCELNYNQDGLVQAT